MRIFGGLHLYSIHNGMFISRLPICLIAGKSKEESVKDKKQELEKRLQDVSGQLAPPGPSTANAAGCSSSNNVAHHGANAAGGAATNQVGQPHSNAAHKPPHKAGAAKKGSYYNKCDER